jgi:preprotein translocase subunit SecF
MTTFVTLLTVWAIEFLGGGVLASFGLALNIGFIVGTYSSIFIASPIAVWLDRYFTKRSQQKTQVAA